MLEAPVPDNDDSRIRALKEYDLLDTPREEQFDAIARLASFICGTEIGLISLIDRGRLWLKASQGLPPQTREVSRAASFCGHAILQEQLFEISDSLLDDRFRDNPYVQGAPYIRFYAGVPLINPQGYPLGTLCVIDKKPKRLSESQRLALRDLADVLLSSFEDRKISHFSQHVGKILNKSHQDVLILDCGIRRFIYANELSLRRLAIPIEQLADFKPEDIFPELAGTITAICDGTQLASDGELQLENVHMRSAAGAEIPARVHITSSRMSGRHLLLLIAQDQSELLKAKEATRHAQIEYRKLALVAQHTDNPVIITNAARQIEWVNPSFERMTGFRLEEAVGKPPGSLLQGAKTDPDTIALVRQKLNQGQPVHEEILNYTKDGRERWLAMEIQPIFDDDGKLTHFVGIQTDITARREEEANLRLAKEKAESATREKSKFLANISHELRTPLNGIVGIAELLTQPLPTNVQQDYLLTLNESAENLLHIINDLLDLSKIESGTLSLEEEPLDLGHLVTSVEHLFRPRAESKSLTICSRLEADVPRYVKGDQLRLKQIFMNLVGNAVKFTESGRISILVKLLEEKDDRLHLHCSVKDTGPGIPSESLDRIFNAFVQSEASSARRLGGTGLGLTICRKLLRLMGGHISVASEVSKGSDFCFDVWLKRAAPEEIPDLHPLLPPERQLEVAIGRRALVVDDNPVNRKVASAMLKNRGMEVYVATGSEEAMEIFKTTPLDVVFTDIQMPGADGFELTRNLRRFDALNGRHTSIIALTAHADEHYVARCLAAGMDGYLTKPVTLVKLTEMLQSIFGQDAASCNRSDPATKRARETFFQHE